MRLERGHAALPGARAGPETAGSDDQTGRRTAIDLFAGAGGLTLGLKRAEFDVVAAVEIDPLAAQTYRRNHPDTALHESDIRELDPRSMATELGLGPGELDLLAACPPCQGFSSVRTRNGAAADDERNDLVSDVMRFAEAFLPRAVMVENVPGLKRDARRDVLCNELKQLDYAVEDRILDAAEYGVPQRRPRYIMIAVRDGKPQFARRARLRKTVADVIASLPEAGGSDDPLHDHGERRSANVARKIRMIPLDGGSRSALPDKEQLPCHTRCDGFKDIYGRMAWKEVSPTITGGCVNPSKGRFLHPKEHRAITLREAAMLQGFPRDYHFSLDQGKFAAAQMIGNALPPPFIERHARQIARVLERVSSAPRQD